MVHAAARSLAGAERTLAGRGDPLGLAEAVRASGETVTWERVAAQPAADGGLARLGAPGGGDAGLAAALADASATGVPLEPGVTGGVGALLAVHLEGNEPPEHLLEVLGDLAPLALLTARAATLRARLAREQGVLTALAESTGTAVIEWDAAGRISGWRGPVEAVLGIDPVAILGRQGAVAAAALAGRLDADAERRLAVSPGPIGPEHLETRDGRELRHERRVVSAPDEPARVLDVFQDVTRERRALADSARLAVEKAALAEVAGERTDEVVALSRAAHAMASQITSAGVHERLLAETLRLVGGEKAAVLELDPRGDLLPAATAGFSEQTVRRMIFRSGQGLAGTVVAEGRPYVCHDIERDPRVSRRIVDLEGIRSFLHVPIVLGERVYGLVSANAVRPDAFGEREVRVLGELARHAAAALANARRYEHERHVAETLQRSLLTHDLPEIDGLSLAALYRPSEGALVGGDFYGAWDIAPGRVGVLIGDVSGKGVEAAGRTAMIRSMAEALSRRGEDPGEVMTALNDLLLERMPAAAMVTVLMVVIDSAGQTLRWTSAGHPPALLVGPDRAVRTLDDPDPPCAALPGTVYRTHVESFEPGDVLFAYTDGLIEARREGAWFEEAGVRRAVLDALDQPPAEMARSVHAAARAWAAGRIDDDVAIAVVRRLPAEASRG